MPNKKKKAARQFKEDWSRRRFYETMRYLFRGDRSDDTDPVTIPFYRYRPLTHKELRGCINIYIENRKTEDLQRILERQIEDLQCLGLRPEGKSAQPALDAGWPDLNGFCLSNKAFMEAEVALGRLYFAKAVAAQRRARTDGKKLAQRGPVALRKLVGQAIRQTPQAHRRFSSGDVFLALRPAYFEQQFIWTFLRRESGLRSGLLKDAHAVGWAAEKLASAYPYLHMSAKDIAEGLVNPRQADTDTAEEFGLSESSIRSLFSKYLSRR